jgi:hypothetical protein
MEQVDLKPILPISLPPNVPFSPRSPPLRAISPREIKKLLPNSTKNNDKKPGQRFAPRTMDNERQCTNCGETDTPQWRGTLCNACALWKRSRGTDRPLPLLFPVRKRPRSPSLSPTPSLSPSPEPEAEATGPGGYGQSGVGTGWGGGWTKVETDGSPTLRQIGAERRPEHQAWGRIYSPTLRSGTAQRDVIVKKEPNDSSNIPKMPKYFQTPTEAGAPRVGNVSPQYGAVIDRLSDLSLTTTAALPHFLSVIIVNPGTPGAHYLIDEQYPHFAPGPKNAKLPRVPQPPSGIGVRSRLVRSPLGFSSSYTILETFAASSSAPPAPYGRHVGQSSGDTGSIYQSEKESGYSQWEWNCRRKGVFLCQLSPHNGV